MLYYLFAQVSATFSPTQLIVVRSFLAFLSSLALSLTFGSWFIRHSASFQSVVREDTPESHQVKNNTPTMGGLFILAAIFMSALLWSDLSRPEVSIFLVCLLGFGGIGCWDDLKKIRYKRGIRDSYKFAAQIIVGLSVVTLWYFFVAPPTELSVPFFKTSFFTLGLFLLPWATFILIGASNAVNLTDGLDGLAIGSLILTTGTFSVICFVSGIGLYAEQFMVPFTSTTEIAIIGASIVGASLGFLWFNGYPAQVFMGDVGSLALGSGIACMALMARQELLLALAGGIFVFETLSVMIQVAYYKFFGERLFKMAPIHHHFELIGWPESKITLRFTLITGILCVAALMLYLFA